MGNKVRSWLSLVVVFMLLFPLLVGCLNTTPANSDEPKVLKIMGFDEQSTRREWTQLYEITNPNVTIEVISMDEFYQNRNPEEKPVDPYEKMKEAMTGPNAPDVVFIQMDMFPKMLEDGLLAPLETYIEKDKFDLEGIVPVVKDGIRDLGNGTLYALAPNFGTSALFYNKDFFDNRGIPYPTDKMNWEEVFTLAEQLKYEENGEMKYGFSFTGYSGGDPWWNMQNYIAGLGISMFDPELKTLTVNTPQWENVWNTIISVQKDELIPPPFDWEKYNREGKRIPPYADHDFLSGRAAMAIMNYGDMRWISDVLSGKNRYYGPEGEEQLQTFEWDVVTVPVHPEAPDVGGRFYLNGLMGINANAQSPDLAWDFISFINGEEVAKVRANASWDMVSRAEFIQPPNGLNINMEAFYTLKPAPVNNYEENLYRKFQNQNPWELMEIGRQEFQAALNGDKTVQQALADFETKGQEVLDRLNSGAQNQPGNVGDVKIQESTSVEVKG